MPAYNESSIIVKSSVSRGTTFLYERCCNLFWDDEMQLQYLFYILIRKDIEIVSYYNCFHKLLLSHSQYVPCHQKDNFIKSHFNLRGFKVSIRKLILVIGTLITLFHADRMESSLVSTAPWVPLVTSPFLCKQGSNWLECHQENSRRSYTCLKWVTVAQCYQEAPISDTSWWLSQILRVTLL